MTPQELDNINKRIAEVSRLNYILGRLEGLACGALGDIQTGILDTCEMLAEIIAGMEDKYGRGEE